MDYKTIDNNFTYHSPSKDQIDLYTDLRDAAKKLADLVNHLCPESREKTIAITKVEEAVMWANASIARNT